MLVYLPHKAVSIATGKAKVRSTAGVKPKGTDRLVLEEFAFELEEITQPLKLADQLASALFPNQDGWYYKLKNDLVILADEDFGLLRQKENATEVIAVKPGSASPKPPAPSRRERYGRKNTYPPKAFSTHSSLREGSSLPRSQIDKEAASATEVMRYVDDTLSKQPRFQLGGNATLGKGHLFSSLQPTNS